MAIRDSSLEAFRDLQQSGGITAKQLAVLQYVFENQDVVENQMVTRADVELALRDETQSLGPRFAELQRMGLLEVAGRKRSGRTDRSIQGWRIPKTFNEKKVKEARKRLTTSQALEQLINEVVALIPECKGNKHPLLVSTALEQAVKRARDRTKLEEA